MIDYENTARKLPATEPDYLSFEKVHRHDPKKVIAFQPAAPTAAAESVRPHPSLVSRHRRMERRAAARYRTLVLAPRMLSGALLISYLFVRFFVFAGANPFAALNLMWVGAYALAGASFLFDRLLAAPAARQ